MTMPNAEAIEATFTENVGAYSERESDWHQINLHNVLHRIAVHSTSNVLGGHELSENPLFLSLIQELLEKVFTCAWVLNLFPDIMHK
jgi:hypothetical protein